MELKSADGNKFATLVDPVTSARNDKELVADVERAGGATIRQYVGWTFQLRPTETITAAEFREQWRGD